MASNLNSVTLSGRLTRDPELKHLPSGIAVAEIGLAVNKSVKQGDEWVEKVSFIDVSVFGGRGEQLASKGKTGDSVTLVGELKQDRWENAEGETRSKVVVVARQIEGELFFRKAEESAAPAPASQDDEIPF